MLRKLFKGEYDAWVFSVEFAELAVKNIDVVKNITPIKYNFPLFSSVGFNVLKVRF